MFEHSVKVPRLYKLAGNIVRQIKEEGGSLKSLVFQEKNKHYNVQALYALVFETIRHDVELSELFTKTGLLVKEDRLDPWLARVLVTEMLWSKQTRLVGQCKPIQTINQYYQQFINLLGPITTKDKHIQVKEVLKPRYVRVNTLRLTAADAVRSFQEDGWNLVRCTAGPYDTYLSQVENLQTYDFLPDYHVKTVFVFAPNTPFYDSPLYQNGEIFLQDKATCLAAHLLSPEPGSTVLDMCAAPGMKTTQLAAIMKNEGTIYSVELDETRYKVLCEFVESAGATCVKVMNRDVTTVTKVDCPNVDYVLLDPSCSGSGIHRAEKNDAIHDIESGRVKKLSSFQAKLLRCALSEFSSAKRVIYSTCSLYPQENEEVIQDVLDNHMGNFQLVSVKERLNNNWNNVGDVKYKEIGEKCLYARPESDHTSGFFLAIFEQADKPKDMSENNITNNDIPKEIQSKGKDKRNERNRKTEKSGVAEIKEDIHTSDGIAAPHEEDIELSDKPKKKKNKRIAQEVLVLNEESTEINGESVSHFDKGVVKKKKKKHDKSEVPEEVHTSLKFDNNDSVCEAVTKDDKILKKKRKAEKLAATEFPEENIKRKKKKENNTSFEISEDKSLSEKKKKKKKDKCK